MSTPTQVLDKIARLLRLAENDGATVHEAAVAAATAARLMAEHRLERADVEAPDGSELIEDQDEPLFTMGRRVPWISGLANGISRSQGCRTYLRRSARKGRQRVDLAVVGRRADVEAVRYLFAYLHREIERIADLAAKSGEIDADRVSKNSFRCGTAAVVIYRLNQARLEAEGAFAAARGREQASRAIVCVDAREAAVEAWMRERLKLRDTRSSRSVGRRDAYDAGKQAGARIEIRRGIEGDGAPRELEGKRES